jgi:hypothetical protein
MKRKLLVLCLFTVSLSFSQFNENAPWMSELKKKNPTVSKSIDGNKKQSYTFEEITTAFHKYWEDKEELRKEKGSGYKPFMRWQNYWSHFVKPDGTLPTGADLWGTWERFQNSQNTANPTSDWTIVGPVINGEIGTGLPGIGRINAIAVDPNNENIWYAGAPAGGIWKSIDGGLSWTTLFDEFPQIGVSGIAVNPNNSQTILIATGDDDASDSYSVGVFKSTDGGLTWNQTSINPSNQDEFDTLNEIVYDPLNTNIVWVAGTDGLQKSIDGGDNWSIVLDENITDFKLKPTDGNTVYAVNRNTVFRTTDGGTTFEDITGTEVPNTGGRMVIGTSAAEPDFVYICVADITARRSAFLGVFKSEDSGANFVRTAETDDIFGSSQAWFDFAFEVSPVNPDEMYVGVLDIWKSTDGGDDFTRINRWFQNTPSYTHADIHTLKFFYDKLYAGTDGGIFASADGGVSFTDYTDGIAVTQFYRIGIAKNNASKIVGGTQDNSGFVYNNNEWNAYTGGDGMDYEIDPTNSNIAYGFVQFGDPLFITNDLGQTVGTISSPDNGSGPISGNWITPLAIDSEGTVYAAYNAVYKLVGSDWERVSDFFAQGNNIDDLEIDPNNPLIMYAADEGVLYRSEDGGQSFVMINTRDANNVTIPFDDQISDISINNNDSNIVYLTTSRRAGIAQANQPSNRGVYKITVDGNVLVSSENITYNLPADQAYICIVHQPRNTDNPIYVGTSLGVYRLDDTLTEWEPYSTNLPNTTVSDLEISPDDGVIVASTYGRGAWQSPIPVQLPDDDVKILGVVTNVTGISCEEVIATVTVENKGLNSIPQVDVTYIINDGVTENFVYNQPLASGETATFNLPTLNIISGQASQLSVTVNIPNDAFNENNTQLASVFIANSSADGQDLFDMETDETSLFASNTSGTTLLDGAALWERGVPQGTLLNTASSGTQVYGTNLDGNHPDQTTSIIFSPCYDLSSIVAPKLSFQMAYDLEENWDLVYVIYSTDNYETFNVLGQLGSQPNWYNSDRTNASSGAADDCQNCPGAQWTGTNSTMTKYTYDFLINAANGEIDLTGETNIQFGILFQSDFSVNQEGVVIDDFVIEGFQDDDDDDDDGILDDVDNCPLIANADQADNDMDGIGDICDDDDDNDGIIDSEDNCPFTANGDQEDGDGDGIGDVCDDDLDNDGVPNTSDQCDDTPENAVVDVTGCPIFTLPANNFTLKSIGESCISSDNGSLEITAVEMLNYTATLTNEDGVSVSASFTDSTTFTDLSEGNYTVCLTVEGQPEYEICSDFTITQPEALGVDSKISSLENEVTLNLSGGKQYFIELNGEIFTTSEDTITLPLTKVENILSVKTEKECQGVYEENIIVSSKIFIYPNPVESGELNIFLGSTEFERVKTSLYSINGKQVISKEFKPTNGYVRLNVENLPQGVYLLNIKTNNSLMNYKILKK